MDLSLLMIGIADNRKVVVSANPQGALRYAFPGNARVATDLPEEAKKRLVRVFLGPDMPIRLAPGLVGCPCINSMADADTLGMALGMLAQRLQADGSACFNHPTAVLGNTRDRIAQKLAGIDGIHMPRTLRLRIDEPAELALAVARHDLGWPVIVRIPGGHRGADTVLIDGPDQVREALRRLPWGGRDLYVIEYIDCRDADGHYRKMRLAIVGGAVFIRHLLIAANWMVHSDDRAPGQLEEEGDLLRNFHADVLPELAERLRLLADAVDLDYFGIDCNLRPDGRLVIYEVNTLMDILVNTSPSPNIWDETIVRTRQALRALLFDPARWRHRQRAVAAP